MTNETIADSKLDEIFSHDGVLSDAIDGYEYRDVQLEMAKKIEEVFDEKGLCMIEAGTGVGKTLAYLVPALLWSMKTGNRVLISTHSLHLQDQILKKDLPILRKIFDVPFKVSFFKGRENYVCLRKLHNHLADELIQEEGNHYVKLEQWIRKNDIGDRSQIKPRPRNDVWSPIASRTSSCVNKKCDYFHSCYYFRARRQTFNAEVVVVNHHLLLSHALLSFENDHQVLPKFDALIIDEAHEFEKAAVSLLGESKSLQSIKNLLFPNPMPEWMNDSALSMKKQEVLQYAQDYFQEWEDNHSSNSKSNRLMKSFSPNIHFLYELKNLAMKFEILAQNESNEGIQSEIREVSRRCSELREYFIQFESLQDDEKVYWTEKRGHQRTLHLDCSPLDVSDVLSELLFDKLEICVLTSATLKMGRDFSYSKKVLGIEHAEDLYLESPFNYDQQMKVTVDTKMPLPMHSDFEKALVKKIIQAIEESEGGCLVLFTNIELMEKVYIQVKKECLDQHQYPSYLQGVHHSKIQMLEEFMLSENSVLFGVNSFWTGVDLRGDNLRKVIITRLPFSVPDHPVIQAKMEDYQEQSLNGFKEFYLPEALLRFKQGIGRLIRSQNDFGEILILDPRIVQKSYGKKFLEILPIKKVQVIR